jgi:hypothetical protein
VVRGMVTRDRLIYVRVKEVPYVMRPAIWNKLDVENEDAAI